jgi:hypothetical protein
MRLRQLLPMREDSMRHHCRHSAGQQPVEVRAMGSEDEENIIDSAFRLG